MLLPTGGSESKKKHSFVDFLQDYLEIKYGGQYDEYVYVSIKRQRLFHIRDMEVLADYPVSTASNGTGATKGSYQTPVGLHFIKEKIGDEVPIGGVFKTRLFTGQVASTNTGCSPSSSDDVCTRIMWLSGMERGINKGGNKDSYNRLIYIHGTPDEGMLGTPISHGCVRMANEDVVQLFDQVHEGTHVIILNN